jgi:L-threonylcarbamoyladenylate synthase
MLVDGGLFDRSELQKAAQVIRDGGVVLYPTDTIYGLGCDPFNREAVERLFLVKGRKAGKGMLVLIPGADWLERLSERVPVSTREIARKFWPGPLTLLLPASRSLPTALVGSGGKVGVRWPKSPYLQAWMEEISGPVVSTSANLSGETMPASVAGLKRLFKGKIDFVIEGVEQGSGVASTVLDLTGAEPEIVRSGSMRRALQDFLGSEQQ